MRKSEAPSVLKAKAEAQKKEKEKESTSNTNASAFGGSSTSASGSKSASSTSNRFAKLTLHKPGTPFPPTYLDIRFKYFKAYRTGYPPVAVASGSRPSTATTVARAPVPAPAPVQPAKKATKTEKKSKKGGPEQGPLEKWKHDLVYNAFEDD